MSFEEKSTWITSAIQLVVIAWYAAQVLPQLGNTPVGDIEYRGPLVVMIGATVVLTVVVFIVVTGSIATRAALRGEATDVDRTDERDRSISRWAGNIGGVILALGVLPALGMAVFEIEHFWIAQTLLGAFAISELATGALKIFRYRRGF